MNRINVLSFVAAVALTSASLVAIGTSMATPESRAVASPPTTLNGLTVTDLAPIVVTAHITTLEAIVVRPETTAVNRATAAL